MKSLALATLIFVCLSSISQAANWLTQAQNQAVLKANQHGLPMNRIDIEIDGIERSILILGETHVKPADTQKHELDLISAFDFRMIEGYSDSGKEPTLKEKALMAFIGFMYPLMRHFQKEGQPSTLGRTFEHGFYRHNNGWLYYNRCYVGRASENGFYFNRSNNEIILNGLNPADRQKYQEKLFQIGRGSIEARRATNADHLVNGNSGTSCSAESAESQFSNFVTYAIEVGDLAKWRRDNICGDLVCLYSRDGKPSSRELRMAENIALTLKGSPRQQTALILVGEAHIAGLTFLLSNWSEKQHYYSH